MLVSIVKTQLEPFYGALGSGSVILQANLKELPAAILN